MVKLFSKSFEERRLFEKRRHPKTFMTLSETYLAGPSFPQRRNRAGRCGWHGRGDVVYAPRLFSRHRTRGT
ncbi:hypothetical protein NJLHNGOC_07105 [Novacetimonas cocois]|uniref:Uncharacterized protein n=1 Tax=Novacetimonas cocois TaxID=1747507 RepID=A0A365YX80_9PROT|nr:hypothetical protein NJLHNGOC_07105 [Novacetimonas cocois]